MSHADEWSALRTQIHLTDLTFIEAHRRLETSRVNAAAIWRGVNAIIGIGEVALPIAAAPMMGVAVVAAATSPLAASAVGEWARALIDVESSSQQRAAVNAKALADKAKAWALYFVDMADHTPDGLLEVEVHASVRPGAEEVQFTGLWPYLDLARYWAIKFEKLVHCYEDLA